MASIIAAKDGRLRSDIKNVGVFIALSTYGAQLPGAVLRLDWGTPGETVFQAKGISTEGVDEIITLEDYEALVVEMQCIMSTTTTGATDTFNMALRSDITVPGGVLESMSAAIPTVLPLNYAIAHNTTPGVIGATTISFSGSYCKVNIPSGTILRPNFIYDVGNATDTNFLSVFVKVTGYRA